MNLISTFPVQLYRIVDLVGLSIALFSLTTNYSLTITFEHDHWLHAGEYHLAYRRRLKTRSCRQVTNCPLASKKGYSFKTHQRSVGNSPSEPCYTIPASSYICSREDLDLFSHARALLRIRCAVQHTFLFSQRHRFEHLHCYARVLNTYWDPDDKFACV